jgi:hypothetical protein
MTVTVQTIHQLRGYADGKLVAEAWRVANAAIPYRCCQVKDGRRFGEVAVNDPEAALAYVRAIGASRVVADGTFEIT